MAQEVRRAFGSRLQVSERKRLLKLEAQVAAARGDADEEQAKLLQEMVSLDPLDGEALILLGQHYASAGSLERAALLFERAAGIEAFEAEAKLRHAQALVRDGRYGDALPLIKRAQELRPREDVASYAEQVERAARMQQ
jgi:Flp pilus assembly protein TadD